MNIAGLLNHVKVIQVTGNPELKEVEKITIDSREVDDKSLFVAIKGFNTDGHKFIPEVINKKACAVVLDNNSAVPEQLFAHNNCVKILVADSRIALAEIANAFYGEPSRKLTLIGITGTKGKSTTAFYIKNVLENAGFKTGLIGTLANYIGKKEIKTVLTTPQSHTINMLMKQMVDEGCTHCVMEVSSHALHLHRADLLDFNFTVFTNITSDHMDYHVTFDNYLEAKKILFDMTGSDAQIVYNIDDKSAERLMADTKGKLHSYGQNERAEFRIHDIEYDLDGTSFRIDRNGTTYSLTTGLVGHFNAYNAAVGFAIGVLSGIKTENVIEGVKSTPQVPGRFEVVSAGDKKAIIDYSHTADSLKQALTAVRHIVKDTRPVYTVFGCGGDRDRTKRPIMGAIAAEMSDFVYVTSDNPRTEDPNKIVEEVLIGIKTKNYKAIVNREEAIKTAIEESEDNAVILIAGKGHETYQEVNGVRSHFSDKELAEKYLGI